MIKAVIFDFDGVINNFPEIIWRERATFLQKRYNVTLAQKDLEHLLGLTMNDQVEYIKKNHKIALSIEDLKKHRESIFSLLEKELKVMPGIKNLLRQLKKKGIKIAIASNKTRALLEEELPKLKLASSFDLIVAKEDAEKPKPDPEMFLLTVKRLNVSPKNCVVIEDAIHGVGAAKKAGMYAVGVCSSFHNSFKDADLVVQTTKDLTISKILRLASR